MIRALQLDQVRALVTSTPEQPVFDWKVDFEPLTSDEAKSEFVKDAIAIANGTALTRGEGFVVYGVDPRRPEPLLGVSVEWDDASAQQLVNSNVDPEIEFLLYPVQIRDSRNLMVLHVSPSRTAFHFVARSVGKLREGQSFIRSGSSTRGLRREDCLRLYLTPGLGYAEALIRAAGQAANLQTAQAAKLNSVLAAQQQYLRQMEAMVGLPPGSLG